MSNTPATPTKPDDIRAIGEIIKDTRNLSAEQVKDILEYQQQHNVRFGEAAVALGFATDDDVLYALAKQFNYPYGTPERRKSNHELVVLNQPFSPPAEAIRSIRTQILIASDTKDGTNVANTYAITSPNSGDGKTFVAANLAISLAQMGNKTLLIDANLRSPRLHSVFEVENKLGLSWILANRRVEQAIKPVVDVANMYLLTAGTQPPNPVELLETETFSLFVREVSKKFTYVVIDTPPYDLGMDCVIAAAKCKNSVIVCKKDATSTDQARRLSENLKVAQSNRIGIIFNDR